LNIISQRILRPAFDNFHLYQLVFRALFKILQLQQTVLEQLTFFKSIF